ncbi:hypothetical protein [Wolbachia pipientis]
MRVENKIRGIKIFKIMSIYALFWKL